MRIHDMAEPGILQSVLMRLAAEVGDLAARSRALEDRMEAHSGRSADVDLQDLDFLTQHLEVTATVLDALSAATRDQTPVDEAWLIWLTGTLRLQGMAGRLAGAQPPDAGPYSEMELW